jgi:flagellar capping protein FliD
MLSSITRRTALRLSQQGIRARSSLISSSTFLSRSLSSSSSSSTSTSSTSSSSTSTPSPPLVDTTVGTAETHGFQAETKQLLNIVANALYTDKHVFVR